MRMDGEILNKVKLKKKLKIKLLKLEKGSSLFTKEDINILDNELKILNSGNNDNNELINFLKSISIEKLDLSGKGLDKVPGFIQYLRSLKSLDLRNNNLTEIPKCNKALKELFLKGNKFELNPDFDNYIEEKVVEKEKEKERKKRKKRKIITLVLALALALAIAKSTHLFDTPIKFQDNIIRNKVIETLKYEPDEDIYSDELKKISELDLSGDDLINLSSLSDDIKKLKNLKRIKFSDTEKIDNINDLNKLSELKINVIFENNKIKKEKGKFICKEPYGNNKGTCELKIKFKNKIIEEKAENSLEKLNISIKNGIYEKDLKDITKLDLSNSEIKTIDDDFIDDIKKLKKLTEVDLSGNEIKDISPLGDLKKLKKLYLSDNEIEDISPLGNLKKLTELNLSKNKIKNISPLENLKNLTNLDLSENKDIYNIAIVNSFKKIVKIDGVDGITKDGNNYICDKKFKLDHGICRRQECGNFTCNKNGPNKGKLKFGCREITKGRENGAAKCSCFKNYTRKNGEYDCGRFKCSQDNINIFIDANAKSGKRWTEFHGKGSEYCFLEGKYCDWTTNGNENVKLTWTGKGNKLKCKWKCNTGFHLENDNCVPDKKEFFVIKSDKRLNVVVGWDSEKKEWGKYCKSGNKIICDNKKSNEKNIVLEFRNENYDTLSANWSCNDGYTLNADGYNCDDVNECAKNNGGCAQKCKNTQGGFACSCNRGYTLNADGYNCDDVNECAKNNGGCGDSTIYICINNLGSAPTCNCNSGYQDKDGDGKCSPNCKTAKLNCNKHGACSDKKGTAECICDEGYKGSACNICTKGYHKENNTCLGNAKMVPCKDVTPQHATKIYSEVERVWYKGNWAPVKPCKWKCDEGYRGHFCTLCLEGYHKENNKCIKDKDTKKDEK